MTDIHTHPDCLALLRAVHAAGDHDLERLKLADWLEERAGAVACPKCRGGGDIEADAPAVSVIITCPRCHGTGRVGDGLGERAEFIRVQCGIAAVEREWVRLLNDGTNWSACTGLAANWCPNCGDCRCEDREESMSDPDCPLHSPGGDHCRLETLDYTTEALRRRERELWDREWANWVPPEFVSPAYPVSNVTAIRIRTDEQYDNDVQVTFARGFPDKVTGPLAGLWRACERCEGRGWWQDMGPNTFTQTCPACSGRGHAGALAALGPEVLCVGRVEVTDREPAAEDYLNTLTNEEGTDWVWREDNGHLAMDRPHQIPGWLFDHIDLPKMRDFPTLKVAASPAIARATLSAAVLTVAYEPWLLKDR